MKNRQNISIFPLLIMGVFLVFASSCEKDDDNSSSSGKTTAVFNPNVSYGTMTDQDGNVYKTVTIGTQTWMAENLRTTKYNDGTALPNVTKDDEWGALTTGAYCNYNNTAGIDTIATYGRLYNWYAVNTGKLCPTGWHVPSDEELTVLANYTGGLLVAGGKLKETGHTHWYNPNMTESATNETGFTALPGGYRNSVGSFKLIGDDGYWWSSTESNTSSALSREMYFYSNNVFRYSKPKGMGFSVRCLKD